MLRAQADISTLAIDVFPAELEGQRAVDLVRLAALLQVTRMPLRSQLPLEVVEEGVFRFMASKLMRRRVGAERVSEPRPHI